MEFPVKNVGQDTASRQDCITERPGPQDGPSRALPPGPALARLNADFVGTMRAFSATDHGADSHTGAIDATR